MENIIDISSEPYYLVLQKFINFALFRKTTDPNFVKNNEIKIQKSLLHFYHSFQNSNNDDQVEIIDSYFETLIESFQKKLKPNDFLDLMNCYGMSNFRLLKNIFGLFDSKQSNPHIRDAEILTELVLKKKFPEEIINYFNLHFFDFFQHIPYKAEAINNEQYQFLVNRYVAKYDYNKVINIAYQNFEEVD